MLYTFEIRFFNCDNLKETNATVPVPNTTEDVEKFMERLYSHYPEYTHCEYVVDELVSGKLRVRVHNLRTRDEKTLTIDEID